MCRTLILLCLVALLPTKAPGQEKPHETEYYPLKVGHQWQYRVGSQNVVVKVAKAEEVEIKRMVFEDKEKKLPAKEIKVKVQGFQLESRSDDRVQTETVVVLEDGVYRVSAAGKEITPPVCFLKLPPKIDQTWKVESTTEGMPVQGTFTMKEEEIEVPAYRGPVKALKSFSEDFQMGKNRMKLTYWFAPQVGLVKQHLQVGNFDVTMELEKPLGK